MPDPSETGVNLGAIFKLLEQADQSAKVNNPFAQTTDAINGINWNPGAVDSFTGGLRYSPKQQLVGSLLKGLTGGLSQGFQEQYQAKQDDNANNVLQASLSNPDPMNSVVNRPSGMSPSIFNALRAGGSILQMEKAAAAQNEQEALKKAALQQVFEKNPDMAMNFAQTGVLDPSATAGTKSGYSPEFLNAHNINPNVSKAEVDKTLELDIKNKPPAKALDDISTAKALNQQLDTLKANVDKMTKAPILDSIFGSGERALKASSLDTPEGRHENKLQAIAPMFTKFVGSRITDTEIKRILGSLSVKQFASKDALKQAIDDAKGVVTSVLDQKSEGYSDAGYNKVKEFIDTGSSSQSIPKKQVLDKIPKGYIGTGMFDADGNEKVRKVQ